MDEISIIKDNEKVILLNKELPAWISVTNDCFDILVSYYKNGMEETVKKFELTDKMILDLISEINEVLTVENKYENEYPLSSTIFLTDACNYKCLHCFYSCGNKVNFMEKETLIKCLNDLKQKNVRYLTLTGGEPLLFGNLEWCIKECKKYGFEIFLLTNGSLINDEIVRILKENNVYVQVSLDGINESYEKIRIGSKFEWVNNGLTLLKKGEVLFDISFTPNSVNLNSIEDVIEYAISMGAKSIHIPILEEYGNARENIQKLQLDTKVLLDVLINLIDRYYDGLRNKIKISFIDSMESDLINSFKKTSCALGTNPGAVYVDGKLYACSELIEDQFALIDYHNNSRININRLIEVDDIDECRGCIYKYYCGGGCRFHSYIESGDMYHKDSNCEILKTCYEKILLKIG